jgi:hypothetical protein
MRGRVHDYQAEAAASRVWGAPAFDDEAGRDPLASGGESVGLACRVFRTAAGFEGAPTIEDLLEALS